jgi:hypothetical protein
MTVRHAVDAVRFFRVVSPIPRLLGIAIALVTALGVVLTAQAPSYAARALAPVLLQQMFAASSGFLVPARRGHYDLLLTRRSGRIAAALGHWSASVGPGVAGWLLLGLAELAGRQGAGADLLAAGTWCAMAVVSTLPWAAGIALPRFGSAIAWLVVMVALTDGPAMASPWHVAPRGLEGPMGPALSVLLDPGALVGRALTGPDWVAVAPGLVLSAVAMVAACACVARADVPLEAGQ